MTVYVDDARIPYRHLIMCHMVADTEAELHAMAHRLDLGAYYHRGHYNISMSKRAAAIRFGARQITQREAVAFRRKVEGVRA